MGETMDNQKSNQDLSDAELLRYSRQIMLPAFDVAGQLRLKQASVLIVGLGGLGSPVALYLAAAGVGRLVLADHDQVDDSNLQRQIAHTQARIGQNKVDSARTAIKAINGYIDVQIIPRRLEGSVLEDAVKAVDCVVDCSDNFATRFALNAVCHAQRTPLVSGAAIRMEGHLSLFDFSQSGGPCYQCLYPDMPEVGLSCSESGVMAPLVGIIGSMQALETIKLISGLGEAATGRLMIYDAMRGNWRNLTLRADPRCPCCASESKRRIDF